MYLAVDDQWIDQSAEIVDRCYGQRSPAGRRIDLHFTDVTAVGEPGGSRRNMSSPPGLRETALEVLQDGASTWRPPGG